MEIDRLRLFAQKSAVIYGEKEIHDTYPTLPNDRRREAASGPSFRTFELIKYIIRLMAKLLYHASGCVSLPILQQQLGFRRPRDNDPFYQQRFGVSQL